MQRKICFGGTFNPIHHGHLLCARAAAEASGAESIVLIPTGSPPHKPGEINLAASQHRLAMCQLAIANQPSFAIDDRELRRPGPSFTIDTARELRREGWNEVIWLIGSDMLNILPTWHESNSLLAEVKFLIMARPGSKLSIEKLPTPFQKLRDNIIEVPRIDISATDIRKRVRSGLPIDFLTPDSVCRFIKQHNLYRDNSQSADPGHA